MICWGGLAGKGSWSINTTSNQMTLSNHGVPDHTKNTAPLCVYFSGGTLPTVSGTALSSATPYYAKYISTSVIELYRESALTNIIDFTGPGSGWVLKSRAVVDPATHFAFAGLTDLSRWGGSSGRIYNGYSAWKTARATVTTSYDEEILEIAEAFREIQTTNYTYDMVCASTTIHSYVNGVRSSAFHNGNLGQGFELSDYTFTNLRANVTLDGWTKVDPSYQYDVLVNEKGTNCITRNMICWSKFSGTPTGVTLKDNGAGSRIYNNIVIRGGAGISHGTYVGTSYIFNNIVVGCTTGIASATGITYDNSYYYNNIAVGNTTNWATIGTTVFGAAGNAGETGNSPYDKVGNTAVTITPASHFTTWDTSVLYANCNFRPASASSPQVEQGVRFFGDFDSYGDDILDADRLNYVGASYNSPITAGSFVTGKSYTIASIGSTDFTAVGAVTAAVTFTDAGDLVNYTSHGFANGDPVYFTSLTNVASGISTNTIYYVVSAATTFQLAATVGGSAIAFSLSGAGSGTIVRGTFKASGAGSGTGTATLNAKVDIGPYEYSWGEGSWPNTQETTLTGYASGSRIKIAKQSDGTEIYNSDSPTWPLETTYGIGTDTDVYIYVRKGSAAPYYKPLKLSATIDDVAGLTYDMTGLQVEDIAAATYTAGVATDWTFNSTTGAITHASGTTRYSVQDLYSWHQDYYDDSATVDDNPLINGITPTQFELINGATISDFDLRSLYGGSIEFPDGSLHSSLYTAGSLAASHNIYVVQDDEKLFQHWAAGHIDILVQVKE